MLGRVPEGDRIQNEAGNPDATPRHLPDCRRTGVSNEIEVIAVGELLMSVL